MKVLLDSSILPPSVSQSTYWKTLSLLSQLLTYWYCICLSRLPPSFYFLVFVAMALSVWKYRGLSELLPSVLLDFSILPPFVCHSTCTENHNQCCLSCSLSDTAFVCLVIPSFHLSVFVATVLSCLLLSTYSMRQLIVSCLLSGFVVSCFCVL